VTLRLSPPVFSVAYCCGYALAFRWNRPLFRYYPIPHQWAWGAADSTVRPGPPIVWYGLVASAVLFAVAATLLTAAVFAIIGDRWPRPSARGWLWLVPWGAAAYCVFLLRLFFL
jgi:hypothetical protein